MSVVDLTTDKGAVVPINENPSSGGRTNDYVPGYLGQIVLDLSTSLAYIAAGVTADDWVVLASPTGGTISTAVFQATLTAPIPEAPGAVLNTVMPVDSAAASFGTIQSRLATPAFTFAAGVVATFGSFAVSQIDTTHDGYDLSATVVVSNEDGTEQIQLNGGAFVNGHTAGDSGSVTAADLSKGAGSGSDLSYNAGTGQISSAAGGTYWATLDVFGEWD